VHDSLQRAFFLNNMLLARDPVASRLTISKIHNAFTSMDGAIWNHTRFFIDRLDGQYEETLKAAKLFTSIDAEFVTFAPKYMCWQELAKRLISKGGKRSTHFTESREGFAVWGAFYDEIGAALRNCDSPLERARNCDSPLERAHNCDSPLERGPGRAEAHSPSRMRETKRLRPIAPAAGSDSKEHERKRLRPTVAGPPESLDNDTLHQRRPRTGYQCTDQLTWQDFPFEDYGFRGPELAWTAPIFEAAGYVTPACLAGKDNFESVKNKVAGIPPRTLRVIHAAVSEFFAQTSSERGRGSGESTSTEKRHDIGGNKSGNQTGTGKQSEFHQIGDQIGNISEIGTESLAGTVIEHHSKLLTVLQANTEP
jgi:hypothetical protein